MGAREQLATALAAKLDKGIWVIQQPRKFDALDAGVTGVVMLVRTEIAKAGNPGTYRQDFEVWVIEPRTGDDAEDRLDDITDSVIEAIDSLDWGTWTRATRSTYDNSYPAYRIDVWVATTSVIPAALTLAKEK